MVMTEMLQQTELQKFISTQMHERDMNVVDFAKFIGVSHPTISRALDPRETKTPTLEFLFKLSAATGTDICELVRMVAPPELRRDRKISSNSLAFAERVERLPPELRNLLDDFLITVFLRYRKQVGDDVSNNER